MTSASKNKRTKSAPKGKNATLRSRMAGIRRELDSLRAYNGSADLFAATLEQLDALGDEIADATDAMMTACENIQDTVDVIAAKTKERGTKMKLKKNYRTSRRSFRSLLVPGFNRPADWQNLPLRLRHGRYR